jgi:hypothetical protein
MPSLIKLDMEFSLVVELKIACVDTSYFVGLTLHDQGEELIYHILTTCVFSHQVCHMTLHRAGLNILMPSLGYGDF